MKASTMIPLALIGAVMIVGYCLKRAEAHRGPPAWADVVLPPYGRDDIKLTTDANAKLIPTKPEAVDLQTLLRTDRPSTLTPDGNSPAGTRDASLEQNVWKLSVSVISIFKGEDNEYDLSIRSNGRLIIAAAPDPARCAGSPFLDQIVRVRQQLDAYHPTVQPAPVGKQATLTGLAFFGRPARDPMGMTNGVEITPILNIVWTGPVDPGSLLPPRSLAFPAAHVPTVMDPTG